MFLAQIVTGSSPGLITEKPDLFGKICVVILYFASSELAALAIGSMLGFFAGSCRLLLKIFKYRWAILAVLMTTLVAVLGSWGVAIKCLHFAGELGDRTGYWGQTLFFILGVFPGVVSVIAGAKASWDMPCDAIPYLGRFTPLIVLLGNYIFGISLGYGICNSFLFLITVWPSWAVVLSIPFFLITPVFVPLIKGILTGGWDLLLFTWGPISVGFVLMCLGPKNKASQH